MKSIKTELRKRLLLYFFLVISNLANSQNFEWAKTFAGPDAAMGKDIAVDAAGNVYSIGQYSYYVSSGPVDLNPGPGVFNVTQPQNTTGGYYLSKLDGNGNFVWAKNYVQGVVGDAIPKVITIDQNNNIVLAGVFGGTFDFDFGTGTYNITSTAGDIFVAKYTANGNFIWAKSMPATNAVLYDLALDTQGNILFCGYFNGDVDMNPGPDTALLNTPFLNAFVTKLTNTGDYVWAKHIGVGYTSAATGLKTDALGQVYITGSFDYGDFDPGMDTVMLNAVGLYDGYVLKLSANGDFMWVKHFGSTSYDDAASLAIDKNGMTYITGNYSGECYFVNNTDTTSLLIEGISDAFIAKIDPSGDFLWAKRIGSVQDSTFSESGRCIAVDSIGNVYTLGAFKGKVDFNPGPAVDTINCVGDYSLAIIKLDSVGNYIGTKVADGNRYIFGNAMTLDNNNNIYFTGHYSVVNTGIGGPILGTGAIDMDPGPSSFPLIGFGNGSDAVFVAKWSQLSVVPLTLLNIEGTHKKTYNLISWKTANEINTNKFIVQRSGDGIMFYDIGTVTAKLQNSNIYDFSDIDFCNNCVLFYRLKMLDNDGRFTYSKTIIIKTSNSQPLFSISPNPANDFVTLRFYEQAAKAEVSIYNAIGSKLQSHSFKISGQSIRLNTQNFPAGVYFIEVRTGSRVNQRQLLVSRPN